MSIGLNITTEKQHEILVDLCERNQPAEFVYESADAKMLRSHVRFLGQTQDAIYLDHPTANGQPISLRPGDPFQLNFTWQQTRLTFNSQIIERTKWANFSTEALAIRVNLPSKINKAQRRNCFRLSLVHLPDTTIHFMRLDRSGAPWRGMLVDLSETGGRVIVDKDKAPPMSSGDMFIVSFPLPVDEAPFTLVSEIRWCELLRESDRIRLGIQWQLDSTLPEARSVQQALGRFIAREQTAALRRQRETLVD